MIDLPYFIRTAGNDPLHLQACLAASKQVLQQFFNFILRNWEAVTCVILFWRALAF
jgi:hypothetical protein